MDYTHLTNEEIDYELALRHVVNLGRTSHRGKVIRLKALTQQESLSDIMPTSSEHVMSAQANIEVCQAQLDTLHIQVDAAIRSVNTADMYELRSRLVHYQNRLRLINPPVELSDILAGLMVHVNDLLKNVMGVLPNIVHSEQREEDAEQPPIGTGAVRRTPRSEEGAVGGVDSSAISQPGPYDHTPQLQFPPRVSSDSGRRGRERVSSVFGSPEIQRTTRNENRTPPPPYEANGQQARLRRLREVQENEARARQLQVQEARDREYQAREDYHRLRDELLDRLLRQERPPPARADERRMLKAIHNWPFKFRGEKDTTSLNVFLDRVETFARSEGMNEDTLLSSVKHLLHEDALDWYARATSRNLLRSWDAFKREIRKEFLPSGYSQILRLEASFRFQGVSESFSKYYRDISALFRFVEAPIPEEEKFFTVKKNMTADYAAIVTAARPQSLEEMVEICTSYDETRMLLNRQRRVPIPHSALLEPNFATPVSTTKLLPGPQQPPHRFSRIHAVEMELADGELGPQQFVSEAHERSTEQDEEDGRYDMDELLEQVNALKMTLERKGARTNSIIQNRPHQQWANSFNRSGTQQIREEFRNRPALMQQPRQQNVIKRIQQSDQQQGWHRQQFDSQPTDEQNTDNRRSDWQQQNRYQRPERPNEQKPELPNHQRIVITCWNCDEDGHRFMDCTKPQAILFCYRCGRKGYSLRSCFTCRTDAVNYQAENEQ
ncbi:uncharacterized protein LOC131691918 [Topomyia yanbarensis]|uniref:uncharacterized protein LOC131691918 n=1 Tax=Topomyia yanbarensis TaxID=2498891 RepID=UPI00273B8779|nr:uncharacterized protein LOC131691918 [Topomyia yanbarensis]XP_058834658.1 uncharacterized protein LOC131691918 [Topomyia yanbarensis]XP_058834659.1 uncharacterized protein LOC131691918 [Topomyia yanbarensis]